MLKLVCQVLAPIFLLLLGVAAGLACTTPSSPAPATATEPAPVPTSPPAAQPTQVPAKPTAPASPVAAAAPSPTAAPKPAATAVPAPVAVARRQLLMASTIGPIDAGIVGALEDAYFKKSGVVVRHIGAGTGATIEMAKNGRFDLVLVHARALEDKFVADGFGVDRRDLMYNDFVILGPASDPAGIKGEKVATEAFKKLAAAKALFVTRGDNSGTHVKEMEVWQAAGIKPSGDWYVTFERGGTGNAPTTRYADERQAYLLMDRATYITLRKDIRLQVLVEKDKELLNYIAVIKINAAKFPSVNAEGAAQFVSWLVSDEAQTIIKDFEVQKYGEPLFFPNSDEWNKTHPK